ncbi:MAG: DnaJ domain-containing protein [FCB group bacterium]|nr:DnaJ domain-containing protein [FCB group bacterium]
MSVGKKILWGGLGWVLGGPIGAILGYAFASMSEAQSGQGGYSVGYQRREYPRTKPGDFIVSLLVLFATVMKADKHLLKSELQYVKQFLHRQFPRQNVQDFMLLFKDILEQDYPLKDVCRQIQRSMDHPSRLELIHVLFGLSQADGSIHPQEIEAIHRIARYLNINEQDFNSIKAMFIADTQSAYKILGIDPSATDTEIKKAYRKMATKYHPDKVAHLGEDLRLLAEEKFKAVNEAYQTLKQERHFA